MHTAWAGLFRHLLRLPPAFFERRHIGDLVSRFDSLEPIRNLLAEGLISAVVDGTMALLTAAMIFIYSPRLGMVVVAALALYIILRISFIACSANARSIWCRPGRVENSTFIETARAIESIKIFNRESGRIALWSNRYAEVITANAGLERLRGAFRAVNDIVFGCENLAVIYLGA